MNSHHISVSNRRFFGLSGSVFAGVFTYLIMGTTPASAQTFLEQAGLVVVETESVSDLPTEWSEETVIGEFTGLAYLRYSAANQFNNPGVGVLEYSILIQTPGLYRFQWRNLIAEGTSTTDANDSWLKIDADAFYGQRGADSIVCPIGYDSTINDCPINLDNDGDTMPTGSGSDGWFKIYRSGAGDWVWSTRTSDNNGHNIFARFDTTGTYTVQITGRSTDHAIDRFVLYRDDFAGNPLDPNLVESATDGLIFSDGFESL